MRGMPSKRRIVAFLATSADGFIARRDGSVDWLERPRSSGDYGMAAFNRLIDTVVWGRKTYEMALRFLKERGVGPDPRMRNVVFSRKKSAKQLPGAELVRGSVGAFARRLRAEPGKNVWLMGGAGLWGSFLDAGALDELIVTVVPVLIGEGIPLFAPRRREVPLKLLASRKFPDGVVRLHYEIHHSS
jgi:dihydrofolate reductase